MKDKMISLRVTTMQKEVIDKIAVSKGVTVTDLILTSLAVALGKSISEIDRFALLGILYEEDREHGEE